MDEPALLSEFERVYNEDRMIQAQEYEDTRAFYKLLNAMKIDALDASAHIFNTLMALVNKPVMGGKWGKAKAADLIARSNKRDSGTTDEDHNDAYWLDVLADGRRKLLTETTHGTG